MVDLGVHASQSPRCGHGFRQTLGGVGFLEQKLALEVAPLDKIAIDDAKPAHAGPHQDLGFHGAEGAAADDGYRSRPDPLLAFGTQRGEAALAGVTGLRGMHHIQIR